MSAPLALWVLATPEEAAPLRARWGEGEFPLPGGWRGRIVVTGMGPAASRAALAEELARQTPNLVINVGLAGGLHDAFAVGALVAVAAVAAWPEPVWRTLDAGAWAGLPAGRLLTLEAPLLDGERRAQLAVSAGLVDMEGAAVAQACAERAIPCLLLKGVSDYADHAARAQIKANLAPVSERLAGFAQAFWPALVATRWPREAALALADPSLTPWTTLAALAGRERRRRHGERTTFVHNLQINPTNVCEGRCTVCGFAARAGEARAYSLDEAEILARVAASRPSEVHLVGGLSPDWPLGRTAGVIQQLRQGWPGLFIKACTAVEVAWFARREGLSIEQVLERLQRAGVDALPGGGAEIFAPRVRRRHFPGKLSGAKWLQVHRAAHRLGLTSNATLLYGLGETPAERIDHLLALRALQDQTGGFVSFVPLPLQRPDGGGPGPLENLRMVALARLVLDNFPHIKAYWPMLGPETAALAQGWGADDLDGTLGEEKVAHAAGAQAPKGMTREEMAGLIREAGFQPVERPGRFIQH